MESPRDRSIKIGTFANRTKLFHILPFLFSILYLAFHFDLFISILLFTQKIFTLILTPNPLAFFLNIISITYVSFVISASLNLKLHERLIIIFLLANFIVSVLTLILGLVRLLYFQNVIYVIYTLLIVSLLIRVTFHKDDRYNLIKLMYQAFKVTATTNKALTIIFSCLMLVIPLYDILMPDLGWDALMYHLYIPASWIKEGSIHIPSATEYGNLKYWMYYPSNAELLYAFILLVSGDDAFVELSQFFHGIFVSLIIYAFLRRINAKHEISIFSLPITFAIPAVFLQSVTAYNDLILAAYLLCSFYFIYRLCEKPPKYWRIFTSISLGLLLGIKYTAAIYTIIIFLISLARRELRSRRLYYIFLGSLLFGGYWYLRNFILTGNPFYPYSLEIGPIIIFKGDIDTTEYLWLFEYKIQPVQWFLLPVTEEKYAHDYAGFGIFLLFSLPLYCKLLHDLKKTASLYKPITLFFFLVPFYTLLVWIIQPFKFTRFLLPALSIIANSPLIEFSLLQYNLKVHRVFRNGMLMLMLLALLINSSYLIFKVHPLEFETAINYLVNQYGIPDKYIIIEVCGYGEESKGWAWIGENVQNSTIAYINTNLPYYLFGKKLTNKVIYVGSGLTAEDFIENLKEKAVKYVFMVKRESDKWPIEKEFIRSYVEKFKLLYNTSEVEIYFFIG